MAAEVARLLEIKARQSDPSVESAERSALAAEAEALMAYADPAALALALAGAGLSDFS